MKRRHLIHSAALGWSLGLPAVGRAATSAPHPSMSTHPQHASVASLGKALREGRTSASDILQQHLQRIQVIDRAGPRLNSIIELNPDAAQQARLLDAAGRRGRWIGPLHGIPVVLKDNIATGDRMATTAGSLALDGIRAQRDAFLVERLREAGAVIVGKTNLSEWANIRSTRSTSGWSSRGGLTRNPHALDRNTSGSSSGSAAAIAAGLSVLAVGTETDGSIVSPACRNGIVGFKPTVGLVSRTGIIPISHTQDTAGPMTRSVADAGALLAAMAAVDRADATTQDAARPDLVDGTLPAVSLEGVRLGVARNQINPHPGVQALFEQALVRLRQRGAVLVDVEAPQPGLWSSQELLVLLVEFKAGLAAWLQAFAPHAGIRSLDDLVAFNTREAGRLMPHFGQELLLRAQAMKGLDDPEYRAALDHCRRMARVEGLDRLWSHERIEALIAPTGGLASLTDLGMGDHSTGGFSSAAAVAGLPHLTQPMGTVRMPSGVELPAGLSWVGPAWSDHRLLALGQAFEAVSPPRPLPRFRRHSGA